MDWWVLVYCGRETRYQQPSLTIVSLDEESSFFFFCISFLDQQPTLLTVCLWTSELKLSVILLISSSSYM
jgi:hypothetical protein